MDEITPDSLREKVEVLSREYSFPINNLFAAKDDYSKPEVKKLGLMRRNEVLIGCNFEVGSRKVSLQYRLFNAEFDSFIAVVTDSSLKRYPEAKRIIERQLTSAGIVLQQSGEVVARLDPSLDGVEKFISAYVKAQREAEQYIENRRELDLRYLTN